jgi:putative transposase
MDRLHLDYPFAGASGPRDILRRQGFPDVGRRHITTLMKKMGIEVIYRKPNTSKRHLGHKIYPYLLRGLKIDRPNQVSALDITYLPMRRGFLFLVVVMDWYSRKILSWRLSNTMHADFCIEALQGSDHALRQARDRQYRSGQPVHLHGVHRSAQNPRDRHQHGRQGMLARQRAHRAILANDQIPGGIPQGVRVCERCSGEPSLVHRRLQLDSRAQQLARSNP